MQTNLNLLRTHKFKGTFFRRCGTCYVLYFQRIPFIGCFEHMNGSISLLFSGLVHHNASGNTWFSGISIIGARLMAIVCVPSSKDYSASIADIYCLHNWAFYYFRWLRKTYGDIPGPQKSHWLYGSFYYVSSQLERDVYTTSHQRRCNVMTLHRR